jgi:flagellar FliL protein
MFDTGTKIINLADAGGRRYLKISIVLEFAPQEAEFYALEGEERTVAITTFVEEMSNEKPILDDLLNTMLSSKMFDEIYTVEGKELLRQDIIKRTNALLPHEHLMYVYFTEFVVQ